MRQSPSNFHQLANTKDSLYYTRQLRVGNMEFYVALKHTTIPIKQLQLF
jgi:hypothetical protein